MPRKKDVSVYKPKGSDVYHCRISINGDRKSKITGCADKRDAEAWAQRWKAHRMKQAEEKVSNPGGQMRFLDAVTRFMKEKGDTLANAKYVELYFDRLVDDIGEDAPLVAITDEVVANIVAERLQEFRWGRMEKGCVSPLYVQRMVVDRLQSLCSHAKKVWKVKLPDEPDWSEYYVGIKRRKRTMSYAEEEAIFAVAGDMAPIIDFSVTTGVRRENAILRWSQVDWDARVIRMTIKNDKDHEIRITPGIRRILESVRGHHDEFVFTTVHECRERRGQRIPVTYKGYHYLFQKVCRRAGVKGLTIHDLRRTAGERMFRATGSLYKVMKFLGHANMEVTRQFYVYLDLDDVEEGQTAMEELRERTMAERRARSAA